MLFGDAKTSCEGESLKCVGVWLFRMLANSVCKAIKRTLHDKEKATMLV
jgi:hypothetical protein